MVEADLERAEERAESGEGFVLFSYRLSVTGFEHGVADLINFYEFCFYC